MDNLVQISIAINPTTFTFVSHGRQLSPISRLELWMWMRVHHCDDEKQLVFGTLDNEPVND
jgi:hypothetical protein